MSRGFEKPGIRRPRLVSIWEKLWSDASPREGQNDNWWGLSRILLLVTGAITYLLTIPIGWSPLSPLPWDCSWHYLKAWRIADHLSRFEVGGVFSEILTANLYPPVHSLFVGFWLSIAGLSVQSWLLLGLLIFVGTLFLVSRSSILGAALILVSPMLGGLAPSFMVERVSVLFLVFVLVFFDSLSQKNSVRLRDGAWLGGLICLTVLSKYNVGLPLFIALPSSALISRRKDLILATLIGVTIGCVTMALFLTMQTDGWEMFFKFAENRSNSEGLAFIDRLLWYVNAYVDRIGVSVTLSTLTGAFVLVGLRDRSPAWLASVLYVAGSMVALSSHPYLLSRNLVGPAVVFVLAAGIGMRGLGWNRFFAIGFSTACVFFAFSTLDARRSEVLAYYPAESAGLSEMSAAISKELGKPGYPKLFVGTINELGANWIWLLADQAGVSDMLSVGVPYPLEGSRNGLDSEWREEYKEVAQGILDSGVQHVIGLRVDQSSEFQTHDYLLWSEWKQNVLLALDNLEEFESQEDVFRIEGLTLCSWTRDFESVPISFVSGWGKPENWGRWAESREALFQISPSDGTRKLIYQVALSPELAEGQDWEVVLEGKTLVKESLRSPPWQYQEFSVIIPPSSNPIEVQLVFEKTAKLETGRSLALAFSRVELRDITP